MARYTIYEEGRPVSTANNKAEWQRVVAGLNLAMATVDAACSNIKVKRSDGKIVFTQKAYMP